MIKRMGIPRKERKSIKNTTRRNQEEKRVWKSKTIIESLPRDLLIDVLARVASSSFTDLFNTKLCCKDYLDAAEDEYIFQRISMDKFPIIDWVPQRDESLSFFTRCFVKGNPEALFRRGMIEYFSLIKLDSGLDYLKRAAEKRHPEATYVYGMILLWKGDESGLNLLNSRSKDWNIEDCRDKIKWVLNQIWINNKIPIPIPLQQNNNCNHKAIGVVGGFGHRVFTCKSCMWHRELCVFSKIVNGVA